jgi:hypothetical protein
MSDSTNRGGLSSRLAGHFALCGVAAMGIAAGSASADVVYATPGWVIPANIDGLYINVETQQTGSSGGSVPGWDINPYSASALTWFNATGSGMLRYPGVTTGSAGNLLPDTSVDSLGSYGGGTVVFGSAAGNWVLNSSNYFGFRFTGSSGQTHYGWGRMDVGSAPTVRTIAEIAFESVPGLPILVGDIGGGGPPPYDPCAPFNPTLQLGSNNLTVRDNAPDLAISGCGGTAFVANYYKFVAPVSGGYTFSTCDSGAATRMALLDGCAPGSSQLACNDNACGSSSSMSASLSEGMTYYVVIGSETAGSPLASPIGVRVDGPPNPSCVGAMDAVFGSNAFDNSGSTAPQSVKANLVGTASATINKSMWFAFTPTVTGAYSFTMCSVNGDSMIAIGEACPSVGGRFECIAFNDDSTCTSGGSRSILDATNGGATGTFAGFPLTENLVAGTTYYIVAGSYGATTNLTGSIDIDGPPPSNCPADLDGDGVVGGLDLSALLAAWQLSAAGDVDGDGDTDGQDLTGLLAAWGTNGC